ncbi:hypothetical protein DER29_2615 [Micromonospora sp. M71_S20]|uniref:hypothetical protein n=1 Tax=Micromonospora sp. M71_S20 TaxID=592872 RepID=UPI000F209C96|nr:hypothetical protein [Micromonospora sp. M71_S20]RLK24688.1 hypothetical protein DER29_2615 [Micromonospora sp. M71_S20]
MNNRTTGTPNSRPAATGPKPPMQFWDAEDVDAAGRAGLHEIQRRFEETWDVKAGLQEILLAEHYHRAVEAQEGKFDVKAGLAEIVGPPSPSWVDWVNEVSVPSADGGVDLVGTDNGTCEVYEVKVTHQYIPTPRDTLEQIRLVACRILAALMGIRQADGVALIKDFAYAEAMSIALRSAERLQGLPGAIEDRLVTREQAVQVLESAGSACEGMLRQLHLRTYDSPSIPQDIMHCEEVLLDLSKEAFQLCVPVQRLFDPSDDLVDMLR